MNTISIELRPVGQSRFEARLQGQSKVICTSARPFIDAARELAQYALKTPDLVLVAYHEGSDVWCLRGMLKDVAWISANERTKREIRLEKRTRSSWA